MSDLNFNSRGFFKMFEETRRSVSQAVLKMSSSLSFNSLTQDDDDDDIFEFVTSLIIDRYTFDKKVKRRKIIITPVNIQISPGLISRKKKQAYLARVQNPEVKAGKLRPKWITKQVYNLYENQATVTK